MLPMVRRFVTRIFGSDEVEQVYSVSSGSTGKVTVEHVSPQIEEPVVTPETPKPERARLPRQDPEFLGN